jgi:hypothetical protein
MEQPIVAMAEPDLDAFIAEDMEYEGVLLNVVEAIVIARGSQIII